MTERIRTTISLTPEAYEVFKRMAAAANMSVSRAMGDWLTDTADAAMMITTKMEEAKSAPVRVMRELQAMVAGMVNEVDDITEIVREKRRVERAASMKRTDGRTRERPPARPDSAARPASAAIPPSSNTGGKSPKPSTPRASKGGRE